MTGGVAGATPVTTASSTSSTCPADDGASASTIMARLAVPGGATPEAGVSGCQSVFPMDVVWPVTVLIRFPDAS